MNIEKQNIINWELLTSILEGSATIEQKQNFNNWIADSGNEAIYNEIENIWKQTGSIKHLYSVETNNAWSNVANKTIRKNNGGRIRKLIIRASQVAAILVVFLILAKLYLTENNKVIESGNLIVDNYVLPDNSSVTLNENSKLTYKNNFRGRIRQVELEGEAFFDVQRNPDKPFIIETSNGLFEVLGTSFNIKTNMENEMLELYVSTGKVKLTISHNNEVFIAQKGESIIYNTHKQSVVKKPIKNNNYLAWKTKVIEFDNMALSQVISVLESVYNTKIIIKNNELNDLRFSASFKKQPLEKILKVIALTFDIEVNHVNNTIELQIISE